MNNEAQYDNLKILIKRVSIKLLNNKNNSDLFLFNRILYKKYKIVILLKSKLALVGVFSQDSTKSFHNLLLIHLYISLINFKGDSINKINNINKYIIDEKKYINAFYNFQQFIEENKGKIKKNQIKNISNVDFLELSIYDKYFLKYCIFHFEKVMEILTKREDIDLSYTKFLNLYIIDINSDQILLDLGAIQNLTNIKYYNNKNLFDEILFHSHQLYKSYIDKYSHKFTKSDSSHRFVKFECTSTYPRLLFIIRFIPILKGIVIVHIYYQKKLSRANNNNSLGINQENRYKEVDLVFGSILNENGGIDLKYVMPKKLNEIEKFCEEFFVTTRNSDMFKLNDPHKQFKYFNYNIINIINDIPIDVVNDDQEKIFEYINNMIKSKFIEEHEKNKNKKINKKKSEKNLAKDDDENINNSYMKKENSLDKIFCIDKKLIYKDLFEFNNDKNIGTIQVNDKNTYSTIKTNNNIIKILRDSENSLNNNNATIKKNKKNNQIKEEKFLSIPSEIKTVTLMSESNLLSKEDEKDENSKNVMIENFSLISEIKKNDSVHMKLIPKYHKKDNLNLKKYKFQDLLNNTSSKNGLSSLQNIKEKSKIIEESESVMMNKEKEKDNSKNLIIKKEDKNDLKIRSRLNLFDNNPEY